MLIPGDARRVKLVKYGGIGRENPKENRKGAKNDLGIDRPPQMVGETHTYACDGKYQCLRMMPEIKMCAQAMRR